MGLATRTGAAEHDAPDSRIGNLLTTMQGQAQEMNARTGRLLA